MRQLLKTTFTVFVALVFTAGMAFGQVQDGTSNQVTVEQFGDRNDASIQQIQESPSGGKTNKSFARQNGVLNDISTLIRNKNYYTSQTQKGNRNEATIQTTDGGNGGEIYQTQKGNRNNAQVGGEFGQQFAKQVQNGDENEAVITGKMRRGSEARQFQYGDKNRTYLGVSFAKNSKAYQLQNGDLNRSIIRDFSGQSPANGGDSKAVTKQVGDRNLVESAWNSYVNNDLTALQTGNRNEVQSTFGGPNNTQSVTQSGNRNTAIVNQSGTVTQN